VSSLTCMSGWRKRQIERLNMDDKELFLKALDNAVYWQNHCVCLEEIIEMFCMDAEVLEQENKNDQR